jgi:hypothetical protein
MVIMVIVSFFQLFDNHDYLLELTLLIMRTKVMNPTNYYGFVPIPITTQHWFECLDQKYA